MDTITYKALVARYGEKQAFGLLLTIEKMARIQDSLIDLDEEARLKRALDILDDDAA